MTGSIVTVGPLSLTVATLAIPFRDPFRIARDLDGIGAITVVAEAADADLRPSARAEAGLRRDGRSDAALTGLGEGFPDAYYGETDATIHAVLPLLLSAAIPAWDRVRTAVAEGDAPAARAALDAASDAMLEALGNNGAARCALDMALRDLAAHGLGIPLYALEGLSPEIPPTDFTVGIDEPEIVAERAARAAAFPFLKVKVGGPADIETLERVRAVFAGPIRVDANTGWDRDEGARLVPQLVRLGVELIEQPFPAHRIDDLAWLQERSTLPIVADESAVTIVDLDGLVGVVAGVNVKLAKCGGVGPARRMLARARGLGFRTFLGCMEETSVGIAGSAAVASLAEWVDLDGCLLLADDPFEGLELDADHRWRLTDAPGLGVRRRS
jgi:L-alanine-DL-glutamate epimerase-like enolase superfamily enzyme